MEPEVIVPLTNDEGEPLNEEEKIEKLVADLKKAYKKNQTLAKANKSLRLQLHQATKKTLSQKSKHEIVREVMSVSLFPFKFSIVKIILKDFFPSLSLPLRKSTASVVLLGCGLAIGVTKTSKWLWRCEK